MFAYIEGTVDQITEQGIVLDHQGMGYELVMPASDLGRLSGRRDMLRVYTYFQASENGVFLYGFLSREAKELFLLLTSVNSVGPKAAISILGTLSAEDLRFAIIGEDVKALSAAPGVGSKIAKRIILDLKDKIDTAEAIEARFEGGSGEPSEKRDATEALVALGYSSSEVLHAFSQMEISEDMTAEVLIREALKHL